MLSLISLQSSIHSKYLNNLLFVSESDVLNTYIRFCHIKNHYFRCINKSRTIIPDLGTFLYGILCFNAFYVNFLFLTSTGSLRSSSWNCPLLPWYPSVLKLSAMRSPACKVGLSSCLRPPHTAMVSPRSSARQ